MSKADPIYSKADQPGAGALPPELEGKSTADVAAYYKRREEIILARARELVNRPVERPPEKPPEKEPEQKFDLFADPKGSIERTVRPLVQTAADRAMAQITPALVNSCKVTMASNHRDWSRWAGEVEHMMGGFTDDRKTDPANWEIAYRQVKGMHADELQEEARVNALKKPENPVERSTPKGQDAPQPKVLSPEEKKVAFFFNISEDQYRTAAERYDSTDGALPITYDDRKPRSRKQAS
jgi:hypothetical protein